MKTKEEIEAKKMELFDKANVIFKDLNENTHPLELRIKLREDAEAINNKVAALMWVTKTIENL